MSKDKDFILQYLSNRVDLAEKNYIAARDELQNRGRWSTDNVDRQRVADFAKVEYEYVNHLLGELVEEVYKD